MKTGVQKLFEAAEQVQEITQELVAKEQHMGTANMEAAKVIPVVSRCQIELRFCNRACFSWSITCAMHCLSLFAQQVAEMEVLRSAAEVKTKEVQESKATAEILVQQVNVEKAIAEEELSAAEVILKEAEEAVKVRQVYLIRGTKAVHAQSQ